MFINEIIKNLKERAEERKLLEEKRKKTKEVGMELIAQMLEKGLTEEEIGLILNAQLNVTLLEKLQYQRKFDYMLSIACKQLSEENPELYSPEAIIARHKNKKRSLPFRIKRWFEEKMEK